MKGREFIRNLSDSGEEASSMGQLLQILMLGKLTESKRNAVHTWSTYEAQMIFLDLIVLMIIGEEYKSIMASWCFFSVIRLFHLIFQCCPYWPVFRRP
jgi:hypothetical protein